MRCFNKQEIVTRNRYPLATHSPPPQLLYQRPTAPNEGQQRQSSLRPDFTPTFPPTGSTKNASDGDYRTNDFPCYTFPNLIHKN